MAKPGDWNDKDMVAYGVKPDSATRSKKPLAKTRSNSSIKTQQPSGKLAIHSKTIK